MKKISGYSILTITMMSILMLGTGYMAARVYATGYMADQSVATILSTIESGADRPFDNRARLSGIARIEYYKDLRDIFRQVIARLDQNIGGDNGATGTVGNTRIEGLVVNTGIPVTTTNSSFTGNSATTTTNSSVAGNSATSRNTSNTATNNNNTSSSVTGTTATTGTTTTVARDYSQRARCADRFNQPEYTQDGRVYVGDQLNDLGGMQIGGTTYNYNPSMLCGHLSSLSVGSYPNYVRVIDSIGRDGTLNWTCIGADKTGAPSTTGDTVDCEAKKIATSTCGPYAGTTLSTFDELDPGIGDALTQATKSRYCTVGTPTHYNGSIELDQKEFGYKHWECRGDTTVSCKARVVGSDAVNFSASKTTITPGESVTLSWSLPSNTAYIECYPMYDGGRGNSVYDFYNGSKVQNGSYAYSISRSAKVSLVCNKPTDGQVVRDIIISVVSASVAPISPPPAYVAPPPPPPPPLPPAYVPPTRTCPGATDIPIPTATGRGRICLASWGAVPLGSYAAITVTNGGSLRGKCSERGDGSLFWDDVVGSCPGIE